MVTLELRAPVHTSSAYKSLCTSAATAEINMCVREDSGSYLVSLQKDRVGHSSNCSRQPY